MIKKTIYFGNPAYLSVQNRQLVAELKSGSQYDDSVRISIEDIGVLILDHQQIVVSQRVLQLLMENNTIVMVCNDKHMPHGLLYSMDGNTTQSERHGNQLEATIPLKKQLWQQTVEAKIRNQASVLASKGIPHENMLRWSKEIVSGDARNHEARAAAYYWDALFDGMFRRERFGPEPNNLLNYGYAVLRAVVARSLVGSGMLLSLGIHHHNKYNSFCLADDIMEPYRPYVDQLVLKIIDEEEQYEELTPELKKKLLVIPALDVVIDDKRSPLMIATQRTSASLAKCFAGETRKMIYPRMKND
jgi:CRISP-associated protein Cas1